MEPTISCIYANCDSPVSITCNCSPILVLLCQEHTVQHVKDLPNKLHNLQDLYLPLEPHEKDAFLHTLAPLLKIEGAQKAELLNVHSRNSAAILKELSETTKRQLSDLKMTNHTYLKGLKQLSKNMNEMRAALTGLGRFGVPTFKKDEFSIRLESLKQNNQVFGCAEILQEIQSY